MKKFILSVIIAAALAASFAAGCRATMLSARLVSASDSARLVSASDSARLHPSYVISYRFGPLWFNEIYD